MEKFQSPVAYLLLVLAIVLVVVLAGCSAGNRPAASSETASPMSLSEWTEVGGLDQIEAVADSMELVASAASYGSPEFLAVACEGMADAVKAAQSFAAVPVESVRSPYEASLEKYSQSADACIKGAKSSDVELLTEATAYAQEGQVLTRQATAAISARS